MMTRVLRLLGAATVAMTLTGCFPRLASYGNDPVPRPGEVVTGPLPPFQPEIGPLGGDRVTSFIRRQNPFLPAEVVGREAEAIARESAKHGVPTHLLLGLIATESSFNPRAISPVGAQGLGQMMPGTWKDMGITDPYDIDQNVAGTARYIAWLGKTWASHPRCWELVLASYLAGVGTITRQVKAGRDLTGEQAGYVRKIFGLSGKV